MRTNLIQLHDSDLHVELPQVSNMELARQGELSCTKHYNMATTKMN